MGNPIQDARPSVSADQTVISRHYSSKTWIEGSAEEQLRSVAAIEPVEAIAAFPDLHPGKYGPVGVAIKSKSIHPAFIGNDIGCGMALFRLSLPERKLNIERMANRLRLLASDEFEGAEDMLVSAGLSPSLHPYSLGTVGGGNHFCEVLGVHDVFQTGAASSGDLFLLVHSGSRGLGEETFSSLTGEGRLLLSPGKATGDAYLEAHDVCLRWASLNRHAIALRAAELLGCEASLVCDVPHNLISYEDNGYIHRKGAALAKPGDIVPIAGSRDTLSFVVSATGTDGAALNSLSHGAGRKYDRAAMRFRVGTNRSEREALARNQWGGRAICEDRNLLCEETGAAYKSSSQVVDDLVHFGLVERLYALKPLITYKRADLEVVDRNQKDKRLSARRQLKGSMND